MAEKILVVDDEPGVRSTLKGILEDEGYSVTTAGSGEEALERIAETAFDAVFLDVWLPGIDGLETLRKLPDEDRSFEVLMISGHGTIETAVQATKLGAYDFVEKPLSLEKTLLVLRNALRQRRLMRINQRLMTQLQRDLEILGSAESMERLRSRVAAAALSASRVVLEGERGAGRELIARKLHAQGSRADGPFCELPCDALDEIWLQKALYGDAEMPGRLDLAERGTLFLDEGDRLSVAMQEELASRLNLHHDQPRDVRLIISVRHFEALHESLKSEAGLIRLPVPALREHREDLPLYCENFMSEFAREYGRSPKRFSREAMAALQAYSWPGNVAELRNLVERMLLLSSHDEVSLEDLPRELGGKHPFGEDLYREYPSLDAGIQAFLRFHLCRALSDAGGDSARAAASLGISLQQFERQIEEVGVGADSVEGS